MADDLSRQAFSDLVGRIYDCTLDPERWDDVLVAIRDVLGCQTAVLHLNDLRSNRFLIAKWVGIEPAWQAQVAKHIPEMHGWLSDHLAASRSLDEPMVVTRDRSAADIASSPYIRECWEPYGLVDTIEHFLMLGPTRLGGLGLARHEREGVITQREIDLGRLLIPHLRRAVTISNVLDAKTIRETRMTEALDALKLGVVLAKGDTRIVHANRAAEAMMRKDGPLRGVNGSLRAERPAASAELKDAIATAARDEGRIGKTGLAVRLSEDHAAPLVAHVLPLANGEVRTRLEPEAVAAVFINAPLEEADCARTIAETYRLTPAESRVIGPILSGKTVPETAEDLGVAPTTARTHLNSIFAKTGVSRQSELIKLAAVLAPAGVTLRSDLSSSR